MLDQSQFSMELENINWEVTFPANTNEKFKLFYNAANKCYNKCFSIKIKFITPKGFHNAWLNK